ncbi:MAG: helix-turn-helix domain-containing protein [Gemmatimonadaceae bacterium]|nr:helix-turn-helix domain-containing protein [Gemmatimonadaceae bacterium]
MKPEKARRLEAAGWKVGSAQEFLGLSDEEAMLVAVRAELATALREARLERRWSQTQLARELGSSQSRVAKMEAADPSVSIDLLVRSLIVSGASGKRIGAAFAPVGRRRPAPRMR